MPPVTEADSIAVATCKPEERRKSLQELSDEFQIISQRLFAPRYPEGSMHLRIAQPWDLKRGAQYDVLQEPGRTLVRQIAEESAVVCEAPDCKTMT